MRYIDEKHRKLDKNISNLSIKSDILGFIDPINKFDELKMFITHDGYYKPNFIYSDKHIEAIWYVLKYIDKLYGKLDHYMDRYEDSLTKLMYEKVQELEHKFQLVIAYHEQDIDKINHHNNALFGQFTTYQTPNLDDPSLSYYDIHDISYLIPEKLRKSFESIDIDMNIDKSDIKKIVRYNLNKIDVGRFKINFENLWKTNMQVSIWKKPIIYINKRSSYRLASVVASVLHEIHAHLKRWACASDTGIHILKWGTWYYLSHEEGIATFQWARYEWYHRTYNRLQESYQLWFKLSKLNWADSVELVRSITGQPVESVFHFYYYWGGREDL